jgi:hypothetical protein
MFLYRDAALTADEKRRYETERQGLPTARFEAAPEALKEMLLFPYDQGVDFVLELVRRQRGFGLVDKAYDDPPVSTEQILHPARYLQRDDPTSVRLPAIGPVMGRSWKRIDSGGVGEFDVRVILDQFVPQSDAESGAAGWDGGAYQAFDSRAGTLFAAETAWDSEEEAREATEAFGRWLPLRFGNEGSDLPMEGGIGRGWQSAEGAGAALRSGNRVILLVGPDAAAVTRARGAFHGF